MNYMVSLNSNFLNYDNGFILILKKAASRIKSTRLTYALKKKKFLEQEGSERETGNRTIDKAVPQPREEERTP